MDHIIRGLKDACIDFPKWQSWDRQRPEEAISILRKGIEDKFPWYKRDFNRKTTTAPRDQVINLLMSHTRKYFPFLFSLIGNYDYTQPNSNTFCRQVELCGRAKLLSARYIFDSSKFETVYTALKEAQNLDGTKEDVSYYQVPLLA